MLTAIEAIILGIIQGLTEWLPISSSGHLVIVQEFLGLRLPLIFDVMLHLGTLLVVVAVFRKDIIRILKAVFRYDFKSQEGKMAIFIILGNIPTVVVGFFLRDVFAEMYEDLFTTGIALIITGCILFISSMNIGNNRITILDSIVIGIAQSFSLIPGISRSGVTISTGLLRGVERNDAAKFSFLLMLPSVIAATLLEAKELVFGYTDIFVLLLGTAVAASVGYIALKLLLRIVLNKKLHLFSYYCWSVGTIILTTSIL